MLLEEHLDELRSLYKRIPPYRNMLSLLAERLQGEKNPNHPQEGYEEYIAKLIEHKKRVIDTLMAQS
jgi:hypothetical protein